ncbi:hypothetical protein LX97_03104 [Nonlabens dokdonensis]|uniref:VWA domain-containing protein n=2 Tax=Nonlabens dokdonensis TaxID=328515 RepID=L7WGF3_NONDD|nr:hypothetical protein [Nonlabens dokdonensis]AGC78013.1 hypothetical protein DDD_2886 [Nonlabens dokdonensis DSW-6]PZX37082.1 hypothetical protein LX97_03104 [Nonlabens dokdonensis]
MTVVLMIVAAGIAALIALFQYGYIGTSKNTRKKPWFALLRFLTVFSILLLFIAPRFDSKTYESLLPQLVIVVDDSKSIDYLDSGDAVKKDLESILNNQELNSNFEIQTYKFSETIQPLDSLGFLATETDLSVAITQPQELFKNRNKAVVVLTDGNQTTGNSYSYSQIDEKTSLYPVIYGDTTQYADLQITNINVNRYSYLNNEFPVEVFVSYQGQEKESRLFKITQGNSTLYSETLSFDSKNRSAIVSFNLTSKAVGTQSMVATIEALPNEKNTQNNYRSFAVEVIDQQTNVLILSDQLHPDIGALKKAIESNQQRKVTIKNTSEDYDLNEYNLVVMYGVSSAFEKAYTQIDQFNKNTWVITGSQPDIDYLNSKYQSFELENSFDFDEAQPILNTSYSTFNLDQLSFDDYPPAQVPFGELIFNTNVDVLFYKKIGAIATTQPIWFNYEDGDSKRAVTLASGLWRWRAQSYLDEQDFKNFDDLVSSQVQYLASNKKRNRLEVTYEPFYYQNKSILINAQYLDKNYEFEDNGILNLNITNTENKELITRPFVLSGNSYVVDLSGLEAGDYRFTVKVENDQLSRSGSFSILEYDIEKQQVNASDAGMKKLVGNERVYYQGQTAQLIENLNTDPLLQTVERASVKQTSLIDWKYLLGLILLLLGLEWFLRKYNGLV